MDAQFFDPAISALSDAELGLDSPGVGRFSSLDYEVVTHETSEARMTGTPATEYTDSDLNRLPFRKATSA